jgi:hypothetical protein
MLIAAPNLNVRWLIPLEVRPREEPVRLSIPADPQDIMAALLMGKPKKARKRKAAKKR